MKWIKGKRLQRGFGCKRRGRVQFGIVVLAGVVVGLVVGLWRVCSVGPVAFGLAFQIN